MALPLPVTQQPLLTPIPMPVGAEALVLYPTDEAESVQTGYYFNDPIDRIEVFGGSEVFNLGCAPPSSSADDCAIPEPVIWSSGFRPVAGLSALYFKWVDVADFFWYWPDGDVVMDFAEPEPDQGVDADVPCVEIELPVLASFDCGPILVLDPDLGIPEEPVPPEYIALWDAGGEWDGDLRWDG
jgi:hypothetical protein